MAQELEKTRREERRLIEQLITAQEEERKLIAYDLHDGLIQQMVGARFHLTNCRARCLEGTGDDESLSRTCDTLTDAIVEGRRIIQGLHPTVLDDLGLIAALQEMAQSMADTAGWDLRLSFQDLPYEPEKSVSVTLFRIAQEALNNARKHAHAGVVSMQLMNGEGISLTVHDDGSGFNADGLTSGERGMGITTMHERAHLLNGTCAIASAPEEGTTITVWVPWNHERMPK
jgi:signal transduction histidine kinase